MILGFLFLIWLGHPYLVLMVCFLQVGLFRELVNVKYKPAQEKHLPLFRTQQWAFFVLAMYYVWGKVFAELSLTHSMLKYLPLRFVRRVDHYHGVITFSGYVVTLVTFVLSLKPGHLRYQLGNFCWTLAILTLIVYQVKGAAVLIFAGIFWFVLSCGLVIANDCFAYFSGSSLGGRLTSAPFLQISPNKTWEGFIGGWICTALFSWPFAACMTEYPWLVCPQKQIEMFGYLDCAPGSAFQVQNTVFGFGDLVLFSYSFKSAQVHALVLSCFASVIAPFGGFMGSAIKRAYKIKDFDSLIPGHGGFMDRMDCQLMMLLCSYVYYSTFVQEDQWTEMQLMDVVRNMLPEDRDGFLAKLFEEFKYTGSCTS